MQILHHTFASSLHIGPCAFYISYRRTPIYKMLLHILQNVMGEFSHTVDMSNFEEKHFLKDVMITQLAKMFSTLREICLTLNIPSLARQRCLPSWGPRRTPWFFCNFSTI